MSLLPALVLNPEGAATASVIWLHGLGADGHDFEPLVPQLELEQHPIRFIFPHAPSQAITINNGMVMPAWYDVTSMDLTQGEDEAGIDQSQQLLINWIEHEIEAGIPPDRIFLAGFSQGGAIVLHTGLRYPKKLGGIIALSTYLPLPERFDSEHSHTTNDLPIFMAHGNYDPVIPIGSGERSAMRIKGAGYELSWHDYPMEHSVNNQEIGDIAAWLSHQLTGNHKK
ncbi:MAG: alpha/beta hydrolase [Gammaproteobacteria bacterium]|nr:alpha/beta hydrolase [Gammaproteobacteria bacterium]